MAKARKKSVDSIKKSPIRKKSYEAPTVSRPRAAARRQTGGRRAVPKEYRTFKRAPKARGGLVFFLFLLFIAAAAGFWYWNTNAPESTQSSLELSIVGPDKIISGDEVTYTVQYKNLDTVALTKMELSVYWPDGFYFDQASLDPEDANAKTWVLSDLAPGQTAHLEIQGQLVGRKDEELKAAFNLDYQPANFHSDFRAKETTTTKIKDHKVELAIDATAKTLVDTEQEIKIVYNNLTNETLNDLYLDILLPDDWIVQSVDPEKEGDFWIGSLEPGEEKIVLIKGIFSVDAQAEQSLVAEIGNMFDDNFRRLMRTEHDFAVVSPRFSLDLEINGQSGDLAADWGDTLRYQLEVTNDSDSDIADVQVMALLAGDLLIWDTLDTVGEYLEEKIIWTAEEDEDLALWPAGETKVFTWEAEIVADAQPERLLENIIMINIANLADWEQVATVSKVTVGESLTFNSGVYWDLGGRRVGAGLLPPQVGESTEYLVVWSLPQTTGDFDDVVVSTILPPGVDFANEAEIQEGDLDFDEESRSFTWTLEDFQDILLPVTASFMIEIIPSEEDRGQAITLLNPVTATAMGQEEVIIRSKLVKTSDVVAASSEPIGIVQ
jgi:uncharacterized repeat protein (TIGR01451 family)